MHTKITIHDNNDMTYHHVKQIDPPKLFVIPRSFIKSVRNELETQIKINNLKNNIFLAGLTALTAVSSVATKNYEKFLPFTTTASTHFFSLLTHNCLEEEFPTCYFLHNRFVKMLSVGSLSIAILNLLTPIDFYASLAMEIGAMAVNIFAEKVANEATE